MANLLTISSKGQVTLKKSVLAHIGARPGEKIAVDVRPDGVVELRRAPAGKISDVFGLLAKPGRRAVSIEEMNDVIGRAWAGER